MGGWPRPCGPSEQEEVVCQRSSRWSRCARVRNRAESHAAPARFTRRTRLRPSAAVWFGVNPRSPIRAIIEPSTITSSTRALTTATSWMRSIQFGDVDGSRADIPYRTSARTTTSSASKTLTRSRSNASPNPFAGSDCGAGQHHREERREEHREHRRHVLDDPLLPLDEPRGHDHGAAAPDGTTHAAIWSTSTPVGSRIAAVSPMSTPPPSAISA